MASDELTVVWFKRDLRIHDHAPLSAALTEEGQILPLLLIEPSLKKSPDWSPRHEQFINECAKDLTIALSEHGFRLFTLELDAIEAFSLLIRSLPLRQVVSHEETGNGISFKRDRAVAALLWEHGIPWREFPSHGVERRRKNRIGWLRRWQSIMSAPQCHISPETIKARPWLDDLPQHCVQFEHKSIANQGSQGQQVGGRKTAEAVLESFLTERCASYSSGISKPLMSQSSCSRLSPYLTYGALSVREVYQGALRTLKEPGISRTKKRSLRAFMSRLVWHCHFIQKFESECRIEYDNFNPRYDELRNEWNESLYLAWETGMTGFPLVDAAMRSVTATGYLNFRMRAMLVSFLTHTLWLDWRRGAHHLARQFLDYEPGIHYPQFHMQASTTGIHTIRIYNPMKQAEEHDADAAFIKRWLPELASLPPLFAREPWRMTPLEQIMYGVLLGVTYPHRIVDFDERSRRARDTLWSFQQRSDVRAAGAKIVGKHRARSVR